MSTNDIVIEIDGQKLKAKQNQMVIQVADDAGIYIPRFCYHKNLSIAANCRMCLVEVEKVGKPLPACATPVADGMKVFTKSQKAIEAQRAVMEFLLVNHPLDCPICDQGGECELQDLAMGYGSSHSEYNECKRAVAEEELGPLIATGMTRCIHCTRCVRFGDEVAGMPELGVTFRGEHAEIGTYVKHTVTSEVSGNMIDLCPVGALTSKPYRFTARAWEMQQTPSISPHDCLGTNINVHTSYGEVKRVVSRDNDSINETWITDRDRFSYEGVYHEDRVKEPMIKKDGKWETVGWEQALEIAASNIQAIIEKHGADQFGALASLTSTTEELYLLQKITRALGSANIDTRLRESDMRDQHHLPAYPGLGLSLAELEQCDAVVLVGSNLQKEQPLVALRLRKAIKNGADVLAVNPVDFTFNFKVNGKLIAAPQYLPKQLADLVAAVKGGSGDAGAKELAGKLQGKQKVAVIVGALAMHHPQAAELRFLASELAEAANGSLSLMTDGGNAVGAWLAGAVAHRNVGSEKVSQPGMSASEMLADPRKAYVLLNVEPEFDCHNAAAATAALEKADFVVSLSTYKSDAIEKHADIILPVAPFTETAGTFVNAAGQWQSFTGAAKQFHGSRPGWKVLRVMGNFLHLDGFEYESAQEVCKELKSQVSVGVTAEVKLPAVELSAPAGELVRIGEVPIYACDGLTRRSLPLQQVLLAMQPTVDKACIHPATASKYQLQDGDHVTVKQEQGEAKLAVSCDERIAKDAIWIAAGRDGAVNLGSLFGKVELQKA